MHSIKYEGLAPCSPEHLFRLINLVEHYPSFLFWCKEVNISNRIPKTIQATAFIQKYGFSFRCPFTYTLRSNNEIIVSLPSGGPFYDVSGVWRFQGSDIGTKFNFELKLNYKDTWWMKFFIFPILKSEVKNLIKAFERKASLIQS